MLAGADLSGRDLAGVNLAGKDLSGVNLARALLSGADLSRANLVGANLSGADLSLANPYLANLAGADVSGADLHHAAIDIMFAPLLKGYRGTPDWGGGATPALLLGDSAAFVTATGRPIRCSQCGGATFHKRDFLLNTRWSTLFEVAWLDRSAAVLVCVACTHLEWFAQAPKQR